MLGLSEGKAVSIIYQGTRFIIQPKAIMFTEVETVNDWWLFAEDTTTKQNQHFRMRYVKDWT